MNMEFIRDLNSIMHHSASFILGDFIFFLCFCITAEVEILLFLWQQVFHLFIFTYNKISMDIASGATVSFSC